MGAYRTATESIGGYDMEKNLCNDLVAMLLSLSRHAQRHNYYLKQKSWQRSIRHVKQRSHVRHAKTLARKGYRYKGGK